MRLIDADALTDSLDSLCDTVCQYSKGQRSVMCGACPLGGAFDVVEDAPTVSPDMAQVLAYECGKAERKRGRWVDGHCSECGCDVPAYIIDWKWQKDMEAKFCPMCGAEMRGEANEAD